MKIVRDHDKLYLTENRKQKPKEYFKFIATQAKSHLSTDSCNSFLDIGCATGDFVYYLNSLYPEKKITGMDVSAELLEKAALECPNVSFIEGNIDSGEGLPQETYDAVFMNGVHSIFDDIEPFLNNMLKLIAPGGRGYIFGMFNPLEYDVLVKVRPSSSQEPWQAGWNCFSKKSFMDFLKSKSAQCRAIDFHIGIDIEANKSDGLRAWTFKVEDGTRVIVNGTQVIHHCSLLEIVPESL